ncbi:MAG: helix-turn-helix domain-containing protein [Candidatus Eremiobacteraeota bacterium]|nr:helix-turn-helix domain-containing protein [Candidatus Eremiobacteraeota bacterium]
MTPQAIVEFTEALARIAASGGGPKALTTHLAQTVGGGVLLEDPHWRHLAAAGAGPIPASARACVEGRAPGTALRVTAGPNHLGWLSAFGANSCAETELLLRLTAAVIGVELARGTSLRERREDFWDALLSQQFHDSAAAREDAAAAAISPAAAYVTVALETESADPADLRPIVADCFRSSDGELGITQRGVALLVFVPAARAVDASNAKTAATLLPKTASRLKRNVVVSGGIGTVEPLLGLPRSAAAAQAALAIGRRVYGAGHVASYDELGAYPLLYEGADVERLRAFASETLAPLRRYDEKHQTELERTLKLYFRLGQNVKTAASALNVHRHTVFYRLRQIGEITARSLESPHDQLTLRLAVAIDELHNSA